MCSRDAECGGLGELREAIARAAGIGEPFKRRLYVLAVITRALEPRGVVPVLVGGCAVEFYTLGGYATQDIDVVVSGRDEFDEVVRDLGFCRGPGRRHWYSEELDVAIEAPDTVLAGSLERVAVVEVDGFDLHVIGLEDLILDRLRAFAHWKSSADEEWAGRLIALHESEIDWGYLKGQAQLEGLADALETAKRGV